jgi:hypothetical protein
MKEVNKLLAAKIDFLSRLADTSRRDKVRIIEIKEVRRSHDKPRYCTHYRRGGGGGTSILV